MGMQDVSPRVSTATIEAVLRALHARGPLSRTAIGARTGLSRPSVSAAVAELLAGGIVEEVVAAPSGRGRPSRVVRMSTRRADTIGIEIGRRHVAIAIADATGAVVAADAQDVDPLTTPEERTQRALAWLDDLCTTHGITTDAVRRVAVGTPGPQFDMHGRGTVDFSLTRLEKERADVEAIVSDRFGVPVDIGNNIRYTAVAEAHRRDRSIDLVYLRVDQGVGGGIVHEGEAATGALGAAGEMGHVSIDPLGDRCPCGGRGCLELVASLPAVVRAAGAHDVDDLLSRAREPIPASAIEDAATAVGGVLAGVLAIANPAVVVVGGSVATLPGFLPRVEAVARDAAPSWATLDLAVESADTDHLLGAIGAATAAYGALQDALPLRHPLERKDA
jgi:predicted NBD/HSP70 family sugar kinase